MTKTSCIALGLSVFLVFSAGAEEAIVVDAVGVALTPGQTIDGAKPLVLAVGQKLAIISADGRTVKLSGPYNAPPLVEAKAGEAGVGQSLKGLLVARSADTSSLGVVRGEGEQLPVPAPWLVEVRHGGIRCIKEGQPVVFWQDAPQGASETLKLAPADSSWSAKASWPAHADQLIIPQDVPLRDHQTYVVDLGTSASSLTIKVIPAIVKSEAAQAAWMLEVGCEAQAKALIARLP